MTDPTRPGLAVVGAEHLHLFEIVDGLVRAGATTVAHVAEGSLIEGYAAWRTESAAASLDEILAADDVDLVVTVGVPAERAAVAIAAIEAGKTVVSAKPGLTEVAQLVSLRAAATTRPGRPWTVVFTERFGNRAVLGALEHVRNGAIGDVVRIRGTGPHTLAAASRPEWFFDPARAGGILVDLAAHQVDEFLAITGDPGRVAVVDASVGNVATSENGGFDDIGRLVLAAEGVEGHHDVDWLSPAGLATWGDVRLEILGTIGSLEVRANIDATGLPGPEHLIHVDAAGARRVDVSSVPVDWAGTLLADAVDDGERLMTQEHVFAVSELTLTAQRMARRWGSAG